MRADDADEFAGGDNCGFLPELWEMALIASNQVIDAGGVGAFEENIIGGIGSDLKRGKGRDEMGAVFKESKKLLPEPFANMKLRARYNGTILLEDGCRQIEAGWLRESEEEYCALHTEGF